jgi:Ureidoglycolate lyase
MRDARLSNTPKTNYKLSTDHLQRNAHQGMPEVAGAVSLGCDVGTTRQVFSCESIVALIDYLNPALPHGPRRVSMPVVDATPAAFDGFGKLVANPSECSIEIVQWPAVGSRPIDPGTDDEASTAKSTFVSEWRGDILYGRNEAVGGNCILSYATESDTALDDHADAPERMLLWHADYHPDGGQLFFPLDDRPFYVPLALPGDDISPESFVCFRFDGQQGLYIHPNIWHEGVFSNVSPASSYGGAVSFSSETGDRRVVVWPHGIYR